MERTGKGFEKYVSPQMEKHGLTGPTADAKKIK